MYPCFNITSRNLRLSATTVARVITDVYIAQQLHSSTSAVYRSSEVPLTRSQHVRGKMFLINSVD